MIRLRRAWLIPVWLMATGTGIGLAQNPELQQKIAEVKQAAAANKQALAQYTWVEQVTISLKGEQKKLQHFQVRLGPDGKPQKQSMDLPAQPAASSDAGGSRRGQRVKEHVVEKKKDEYSDYADQIKSLIQQYVPPEKEMLEQAAQKGNIAAGPAAGAQGQYRLVISNYVRQGDIHVSQSQVKSTKSLRRALESALSAWSGTRLRNDASRQLVPAPCRTGHPFAVSDPVEPSQKIEFVFSASPETLRREPLESELLRSVA